MFLNRYILFPVVILCVVQVQAKVLRPEDRLDFKEIAGNAGMNVIEHKVETKDGFILTVFQLSDDSVAKRNSLPVILAHGVLVDATMWIDNGLNQSLGLILAKRGYDVWLINFRGTDYSLEHTTAKSSNADYWNFSFHEFGIYDIPATIDYVLSYTKYEEVYFIGFSQGTTALFVTLSNLPEYNEKIKLVVAVGPVAFMANSKSVVQLAMCPFWAFMSSGKLFTDVNNNLANLFLRLCRIESLTKKPAFCAFALFLFGGFDSTLIDYKNFNKIAFHYPRGTSNRMISHFCQLVYTKKFQEYTSEFTLDGTMKQQTPQYNLSAISAPVALISARNDLLANPRDVRKLRMKLPNVVYNMVVDYKLFSHIDFLFARNASELVYEPMLKFMENFDCHS